MELHSEKKELDGRSIELENELTAAFSEHRSAPFDHYQEKAISDGLVQE
jgi:hypothetical protein